MSSEPPPSNSPGTFNSPIFVKHFQDIADLAKEGVFKYGGRTSEAKQIFLAGECGLFTESSGGLGDIVKSGMNYGIGQLPYYPDAEGAPQNTIPGGASLWVFGGKSDEEYKGVAAFFEFLSQTEIQSRLHQVSGYLPVTLAAYEATKASGFYEKNPAREIPIQQMLGKAPTENSKGVRYINLPQLRDIQNEEFEKMLAGEQTAQRLRRPEAQHHRGDEREHARRDHALERRLRGDRDALRDLGGLRGLEDLLFLGLGQLAILFLRLLDHLERGTEQRDLAELTADLLDHVHRRLADRLHRERREQERQHAADEQTG